MRGFTFQYPANPVLVKQFQESGLLNMQLPFLYYIETYNQEADTQKNGGDERDIFHLRIDKFRSQESGQRSYTEITEQTSKVVID